MRIIEVSPSADARWDRYVIDHPHGLIYHRSSWLRVLSEDYRDGTVNLLCEDGGDVVGILPLCRTRGLPLGLGGADAGPRLASLPRSPIAGPLTSSHAAARCLVEAALARSRASGLRLQLKPPPDTVDALEGIMPRVEADTSYVLELPQDAAELRFGNSRNHSAIRRAVAKAANSGVEIRSAHDERDLLAWYQLYLEAMRHHVALPRPYRFFRSMWQFLRPAGMLELLLAEQRSPDSQSLLAGCLYLMSGHTVVFGFNGRRGEELAARPNDALHWHAIHEAQRRGFRRYDFGEVDDSNPGLARFKLKWGATAKRLYRYHDPPMKRGVSRSPGGYERSIRIVRAGWQRVPLRMTARVGDVLYGRYM